MLHQGERVLTAQQARVMDSIWGGGSTQQPSGVTTGDLQRVTASAVNALGTLGNSGTYKIVLQMNVNGKEFYRQTIDDLRAVDKERPEVLDDI